MSTWTLEGIGLPIPPAKFKKKTVRSNKIVSTIDEFPNPNTTQPTRFELQLQGMIWPRSAARALDEATKNAESDQFLVFELNDSAQSEPWITGLYAVTNAEVKIDKPRFIKFGGIDVEVYDYKITFAKYADQGSIEPADEGEGTEEGVAFLDMPDDVGFDANGDGKVNANEFFDWMNNIMSFGIFK